MGYLVYGNKKEEWREPNFKFDEFKVNLERICMNVRQFAKVKKIKNKTKQTKQKFIFPSLTTILVL